MYVPPDYCDTNQAQLRLSNQILRRTLRHERRARNLMATIALVGWVLALAALGGAV